MAAHDAVSDDGHTVLHDAARDGGSVEMVQWLVQEKGMDLTAATNDGHTVQHNAADSGSLELVHWLLQWRMLLQLLRATRPQGREGGTPQPRRRARSGKYGQRRDQL